MKRAISVWVVWLVVCTVVSSAAPAGALFTSASASQASAFKATSLQAPTNASVTTLPLGLGCGARVTWADKQPDVAKSWTVIRYKNGQVDLVQLNVQASPITVNAGLSLGASYRWGIRSTLGSWQSTEVFTQDAFMLC